VWLALFICAMTFIVFLVVLLPVAALVSLFPGTAGILTLIIAVVFAWGIKQAVIEPIGMTALMQVYFKVTEGQQPNPEWDARVSKVTKKFGQIKDKALDWDREKRTQPEAGDEPPQGGAPQPQPEQS